MTKTAPIIDIRPDHWNIVQGILQKYVPQYEVWAFGSRAKWTAKQYSDLDLAIITDKPLSLDVSASLSDDFSDSDLPYKVDIVDWATTSESFRKIIERDKVVVQEGKPSLDMTNEWPFVSICDVAEVFDGPHATPKTVDTGPIFLGIGALQSGRINLGETRHVTPEDFTKWTRRIKPHAGDIVFSYETRLGEAAIIPDRFECCLGRRMGLVRTDRTRLDPKFFLYMYLSPYFQEVIRCRTIHGATVDRIALKEFPSFQIPLPEISNQRAIAHILGTLDDKIELNRKQNETLEAMARALFKAWFVDFEPVKAKMEGRWQRGQSLPGLPAHLYDLFPDRLVDSELGDIPEGWEFSTLGEICSYLNRGISPKYIELGGVSVLNQKCIRDFSIDFSKARRHDVAQKKIDGRALEVGDVLVNSTGVGTLGRVAQVLQLLETTIVDSHVTVVRSGPRINAMYLGGFMTMKQPEIEAMGEGSTGQTELSRTKLGMLKILLPRNEVLKYFAKQTKSISEKITASQQDSEILAQLRDTLLPKLISGELRVPDAGQIIEDVSP